MAIDAYTKDNNLHKLCKQYHVSYDDALQLKMVRPDLNDMDIIFYIKPQLDDIINKRFEKENANEKLYSVRRQNLFILRELVQFIGIKEKTDIKYFYFYLFNDLIKDKENIFKKCESRYSHLMFDTGKNNIQLIKDKFIDCGISPEYFDNQPIKFTNETKFGLKKQIEEYFLIRGSSEKKGDLVGELAYIRETIAEQYTEIINIDGTPIIDGIRLLVNNIIRYKRDNCKDFGENMNLDSLSLEVITLSLPHVIKKIAPDSFDKNIYTNKKPSKNIKINYLIIRTIFEILCEMDEDISSECFYKLLEMTKEEYNHIIDSGIAENKMMYSKLSKYKFPHTMFRGDNPSVIKMQQTLKKITEKLITKEITNYEYKEKITEQILYINHSKNAELVISVYLMYRDALSQTYHIT